MGKVKVGIIGAAGYTAGELIRILLNHPQVEVVLVQSESQSDKRVSEVHKDLIGETELKFTTEINTAGLDVIFLCKGHGEFRKILNSHPNLLDLKLIDLSQDFRLEGDHDFIYGLPEVNSLLIKRSDYVANPGCFATSIQLAILPAIRAGMVIGDIHVSGVAGSTGAGQTFSSTSHFSWRNNNASVYKALEHQHLSEIAATTISKGTWKGDIHFIPYRGSFTRGIITTSYFETVVSEDELKEVYRSFYSNHPFTHAVDENPDVKMVINTNKALVQASVINGKGMVVSVIDNLLKGASGQAVQNMNLMFGLDERTGLNLKASSF